jgi:hypothetical protein
MIGPEYHNGDVQLKRMLMVISALVVFCGSAFLRLIMSFMDPGHIVAENGFCAILAIMIIGLDFMRQRRQ